MKFLQEDIANRLSLILFSISLGLHADDSVSWYECYKLKDSIIVSQDGTYLGKLSDSYKSDSIYNEYSKHGNSYSRESIWNEYSDYGNSYSNKSVFNEYSSEPPLIIKEDEVVGKLSIKDSYLEDNYDPRTLKDSCDW